MDNQQRRLGISFLVSTILVLLFSFPSSIYAFDREYCEFGTNDYSLEWAYEPNTEKIVFVLKLNTTESEFWTGVGFNGSWSSIDFVGVLVRNGQVVMADAYLNGSGVLYTDVESNIQTIGYEYNGKNLLVKFARALNSPDTVNDQSLDGCTTFFLPREPGKIEAQGIRPKIQEFHRFKVCDIKKHCSIDMTANVAEKIKSAKKPGKHESVKFAKSIDVSGSGDPCSFVGKDYTVNWTYSKPTDRIHFIMELPTKENKQWSTVGIGEWMADMDIAVIFTENGKFKKLGDYLSTSYGVPEEDQHNDWKLESSKKVDNKLIVKFSRAVITDDNKNDRAMEGCVFFQFGANLGKYEDEYLIQKHDDWPDLYKACDLRENCAELNFEKRARNRKNKNHNKQETTSETGENNDEKLNETTESSTTLKTNKLESNEKSEQLTTTPSSDEFRQEATPKLANDEDRVEITTEETVTKQSKDSQDDQPKSTPEPAEITEEMSSGEELILSTTEAIRSTEISLDDSSGQEHESEENKETTSSSWATAQPEATVNTQTAETTTAQEVETTLKQETPETSTVSQVEVNNFTVSNSVSTENKVDAQCDSLKQDLAVCQSYMNNYMAQVREWAARHDEAMEAQYGKACALLSAVPHVPTLCCHIYQKMCNTLVSN